MAKKFKIPKLDVEKLRTPECIGCFDQIVEHVNGVMGVFEVHSDELFKNFDQRTDELIVHIKEKTDESINSYLKEQGQKHDEAFELHLEKQVKKEDSGIAEHFEKQEIKADKFYEKQEKRHNIMIMIEIFLFGIFAVAIGVIFISNQSKANKTEVLLLEDAKTIIDLGDKYRDQRYVLSPGETIDKYNYQWYIETVFSRATRGEKTTTK